jgi:hypothetical protein
MGTAALVMPFAMVTRSGCTPKKSAPKGVPSLPKPVITSSKIKTMSCLSQMARSRSR